MLKVRRIYYCDDNFICIQYIYKFYGKLVSKKKIDKDSPLDDGELTIRSLEVPLKFLTNLINDKRLLNNN